MFDNYEDACEAELSREQAVREVQAHCYNLTDFFDEVGDKALYTGKEVLDWLGY